MRGGTLLVLPVTTVQEAADVIGIEPGAPTDVYTPTTALEPDAQLDVDVASARFLGDWFGFGALVLEELRASVPAADDPARVQLWPEHFDLSVDFGDEPAGRRGDLRRVAGRRRASGPVPLRHAVEGADRRLLERGQLREPELRCAWPANPTSARSRSSSSPRPRARL